MHYIKMCYVIKQKNLQYIRSNLNTPDLVQ